MSIITQKNTLAIVAPVLAGAKAIIENQDWKISKDIKKDGLGASVTLSDYDIHYLLLDAVKTKLEKKKGVAHHAG